MALIPGSYARAAGLQSEINNVTITRVAGSEVQFQRTIDTYQKELRYHVNQIGREQKQLRRSMRRYSRKLHHSRKQQKQREAKVKEDAERLKQHAESFKRAEEAVKRSKFQSSTAPQAENPVEGIAQSEGGNSASADNSGPSARPEDAVCDPSAEPDDGVGGESGEKSASVLDAAAAGVEGTESEEASEGRGHKKVFLTKGKLPYLGVKQTDKENSQGSETSHQHEKEADVDSSTMGRSSDTELCLPVIEEEAEGSSDHSRSKLTQMKPLKLGADHRPALENRPVASSSSPPVVPMHTVTITSLNTKAFSANEESGGGPVVGSGQSELSGDPLSLPAVSGSQDGAGRRTRGRTGVSFGDLIKLQHMPSSSTKRLFKMVDRLASKHGIKDLPSASSSSSPSSLDPRSNEKIKLKRHTADSQLPDGIVRQAAVLYSMKYGYHDDDEAYFDDTLPPIILSQDTSHDFSNHPETTTADSIMTKLSVVPHITNNGSDVFRHYEDSVSDMTLRKFSSLSIRHESVEATSPVSALSEAKMSTTDEHTSVEGVYSADTHASRSGVRRSGQVPTMSELSHHVTRIRDRTAHAVEPQHATDTLKPNSSQRSEESAAWDRHSPSTRRMSTLSRHSRPKSRSRRDTVSGQLQKRLTSKQHGDGGQTNAWQSAFGRLKLLHTLQDLSEHFRRSGD